MKNLSENELIKQYSYFVDEILKKMNFADSHYADDLRAEGYIGLLNAVRRHKDDPGFERYAKFYIRYKMRLYDSKQKNYYARFQKNLDDKDVKQIEEKREQNIPEIRAIDREKLSQNLDKIEEIMDRVYSPLQKQYVYLKYTLKLPKNQIEKKLNLTSWQLDRLDNFNRAQLYNNGVKVPMSKKTSSKQIPQILQTIAEMKDMLGENYYDSIFAYFRRERKMLLDCLIGNRQLKDEEIHKLLVCRNRTFSQHLYTLCDKLKDLSDKMDKNLKIDIKMHKKFYNLSAQVEEKYGQNSEEILKRTLGEENFKIYNLCKKGYKNKQIKLVLGDQFKVATSRTVINNRLASLIEADSVEQINPNYEYIFAQLNAQLKEKYGDKLDTVLQNALSDKQYQAYKLKTSNMSLQQIADEMDVNYKNASVFVSNTKKKMQRLLKITQQGFIKLNRDYGDALDIALQYNLEPYLYKTYKLKNQMYTNKEIAEELNISKDTVGSYITRIRREVKNLEKSGVLEQQINQINNNCQPEQE